MTSRVAVEPLFQFCSQIQTFWQFLMRFISNGQKMLKSCFLKPLSVHIDVMRQLVPGIFITLGCSALKQYLASDKNFAKNIILIA